MKRLVYAFLTLLVFISCQGKQTEKISRITLALNWKAEPQFGGFYAAHVKGLYQKHGLNVTLQEGGAGTPVIQMIAAKQVDYGIVSADELILSRAQGTSVVALFATYQTNPQGIMTHASRKFKSLKDVFQASGKIALQQGLPYALYLKEKYPSSRAKTVPYSGGIGLFLNDPNFSQQCFVTSEPILARQQGRVPKTFLIADEGYNPYTTVLVTRSDVLQSRIEEVRAFVAAVTQGWRLYLDTPEEINQHMMTLNSSMDLKTFQESAAVQRPFIETKETQTMGLGTMTAERWRELAIQLHRLGLVTTVPDPSSLFKNL